MSETVRVKVSVSPDGWQVTYLDADGAEVAPPRPLARGGEAPWTFPLPPTTETDALDAAQPHHALCTATDEEPLVDALASLAGREPGAKALIPMGRYLFQVLLGDAWPTVQRSPLRLELEWSTTDAALHRFPWEILHDGNGFLTLQSGVTVLRRVPGPATTLGSATTPLDVLFVVGRALRDDVIRPAAEYLGLTQHLKALELDRHLQPRLLLEATTDCLEAALAERRPAVVHFITHGRYVANRPVVELRSKTGSDVDTVFADNLLQLLQDGNRPLPIVVLSACDTGGAREDVQGTDPAGPFAAELVAGGVPLAVGMSGPVGDLACRLFARAFYSALLSGHAAAAAAAAGRRAAVQHGGYDPLSTYDWALPTLFLSGSLTEARLKVQEAPLAKKRQALSQEMHPKGYPPFLGRLSILSAGDLLLADGATQRRRWRGSEHQVLTLWTEHDTTHHDMPPLGRTWALQAMASRAVMSGHVPCLVCQDYISAKDDPPTDWPSFIGLLCEAMEHTAFFLGIDHDPCVVSRYLLGQGPPPDPLPSERMNWPPAQAKSSDFARAFRLDVLALLDAVRQELPENQRGACRLLLLIDDLHRMGDVTEALLDGGALGPLGLRKCPDDVRLAFTWARKGDAHQSNAGVIIDWLGRNDVPTLHLEPFRDVEEGLVYQNFLLHLKPPRDLPRAEPTTSPLAETSLKPPYAVVPPNDTNRLLIETFFSELARYVKGLPSQLREAEDVIGIYSRMPAPMNVLVEAKDEDTVQQWLDAEGFPP